MMIIMQMVTIGGVFEGYITFITFAIVTDPSENSAESSSQVGARRLQWPHLVMYNSVAKQRSLNELNSPWSIEFNEYRGV